MLTIEEEQHKDQIIKLTEEVLDTKGIECDSKIKISEEQLREILDEVRKLQRKRRLPTADSRTSSNKEKEEAEHQNEEEIPYIG
jgi:hypothetical protein